MSDGMNQASNVITYGAPPPISTAIHAGLTFCSNGSFPAFARPLEARMGHRQEQKCVHGMGTGIRHDLGREKLATTGHARLTASRIDLECRGCSRFEA